MFTIVIYLLAASLLLVSFAKDRKKTTMALKKSWKAFENILPQFLAVILIIGISLAILSPDEISKFVGEQSGLPGMLGAAIIGSVTLIPGFVAFPLGASLFDNGGAIMQVTVFLSTLMAVGVVTLPVEIQYFGRKISIIRNTLAFLYCFVVAILMGLILS